MVYSSSSYKMWFGCNALVVPRITSMFVKICYTTVNQSGFSDYFCRIVDTRPSFFFHTTEYYVARKNLKSSIEGSRKVTKVESISINTAVQGKKKCQVYKASRDHHILMVLRILQDVIQVMKVAKLQRIKLNFVWEILMNSMNLLACLLIALNLDPEE